MSPISFHTAVLWVPRHGAGAGVKPQHAFQRPTSLPNIDQLPHTQFSHFMHEGVTIYHPVGPWATHASTPSRRSCSQLFCPKSLLSRELGRNSERAAWHGEGCCQGEWGVCVIDELTTLSALTTVRCSGQPVFVHCNGMGEGSLSSRLMTTLPVVVIMMSGHPSMDAIESVTKCARHQKTSA